MGQKGNYKIDGQDKELFYWCEQNAWDKLNFHCSRIRQVSGSKKPIPQRD
jgi:hypothetical protein